MADDDDLIGAVWRELGSLPPGAPRARFEALALKVDHIARQLASVPFADEERRARAHCIYRGLLAVQRVLHLLGEQSLV